MNIHNKHYSTSSINHHPYLCRLISVVLTNDFRQRRRLIVVLMTAGVYFVCAGILAYGSLTGIFSSGAKWIAIACICTPVIFFLTMRTWWNLRFSQSSLAWPQALSAQTLVAISYSVTGAIHTCTLVLLPTVMVFGMFEMNKANVRAFTTYSIFLIGLVMAWSSHTDPLIYPPKLELIHFVFISTVLISISSLSSQLGSIRDRLKNQKMEIEAALKNIRHIATHDELTGLPNRRHLLTLLKEHASRQNRDGANFMVALVDLDHFKHVNDTFGHRVGDEALICFSELARVHLRGTDIVGRWGGEEFLMILPESPVGDPKEGIERLRTALAVTEVSSSAPCVRIAFSVGITQFRMGSEVDDVIEKADRALYLAKSAGRNRTVAG